MSYELTGRLHKVFPTESKSDRFQARDFVVEISPNGYTQYVKFQLTQDKCDIIENFNEGNDVKVSFDLRGREWQGKYFTNLNAWKVENLVTETFSADPGPQEPDQMPPLTEDDLPF